VTREAARAFAERWAAAWNRGELEALLAHFHDAIVWTSPKALQSMGRGTLIGKQAVRDYYAAALRRIRTLHFRVERVIWDPESRELSIVYDREVDGVADRASEILRFDASGHVISGEVHYGLVP
jgi:ketosteroid isomerase-like protein